jgi:hypothetical protein
METAGVYEVATRPQTTIMNLEDYAMSVDSLVKQVQLIQQVMDKVMKEGDHYGKIPGTNKPTLLKPGAEKLCLTFRLDPHYEIIREIRDKDWIAYTVKCALIHIPSNQQIASGVGSCNSRETKYRYRFIEESTGQSLPKEYWKAKEANNSKEMKRILGEGNRAAKIDGVWVIAKSQKVENDNPWDLDNTIIKMACKRALVAATLNATAASDIFTQDLEDMAPVEEPKKENGQTPPPPQGTQDKPKSLFDQLMTARSGFCNLVLANKDKLLDFLPDEITAVRERWAKASAAGAGGVAKGAPWPLEEKKAPPPLVAGFEDTTETDDPRNAIRDKIREYKELLKPGSWEAITAFYKTWETDKADIETLNAMLTKLKTALDKQNAG